MVASPKPVAAKPMFATGSLPTELKASVPTVVGAFPSKVTEVSEVAFLNADAPIEVTLLGMVTDPSLLAPKNADVPIDSSSLPVSKVTEVSEEPANAEPPIKVTLFGMVTDPSLLAPKNADVPIDSSSLPVSKVTEVSEVAFLNASTAIEVTLLGITASPAQFVLPVTTLSVILNEPLVLQLTVRALTIVRPFHVVAVPKPVAAKLTFTTRSAPTLLKALLPTLGALPAKVIDFNSLALLNA